jgi:serine/threonine protein kinase/tetratricopeptide (TPR) repeat protein
MSDDRTLDFNPDDDRTYPLAPEQGEGGSGELIPGEDPDKIGHYRLVRRIGEGGMGLVYEAEQLEPIRRKVALKVVKRGMDTAEFVARFESERQALAMMDHPAIARVFDAGASESGRPYFVMEYVEGIPINDYCDEHKLSVRERLELFIHVCDGVQHAHQKAIIHRDLKPSNVLVGTVDGKPAPKIIDFGVAKAMDHTLFDNTMTTSAGQLVGTPEYMSPEQADMSNQGIDTRTDVYALGVVLYELLVGQLPFPSEELKKRGFYEVLRIIREDEPPTPSTRAKTLAGKTEILTEVARNRRVDPTHLTRALRGDLDWITMRALEKDRTRRYETVKGMAQDVHRFLKDEPVSAGPPGATYRVKKFVRRHRTGVAAAMFVFLAIIMGIVGTTTGLIRAVEAEKHAREEAATARKVSDFLVDIFEVSDPDQAKGNTITAREILDLGSRRIEDELATEPLIRSRLMNTIGKVYRNLGLYDEASPMLETALELRRQVTTVEDVASAELLADLANLYIDQGRYPEAEVMLTQAVDVMNRHGGEANRLELAESINKLASVYRRQGKYDLAEPLYYQAKDIRVAVLGPDDPEVARSYNSLGILNWTKGNYDEAERLYRQALDLWEKAYGNDHSDVAKACNNLALLLTQASRNAEAEALYERAADIYEKVLGPDHPRLALALNNLALVHQEMEELDKADPLYRRALDIRERSLGPDHPDVAQTLNNLANLERSREHFAEAESLYTRALEIRIEALGPEHVDVGWSLRDLGKLAYERGDPEAGLLRFERAVGIFEASLGADHPDLSAILKDYAEALDALGRYEEAKPMLERAITLFESALGPDHPELKETLNDYEKVLRSLGLAEEAAAVKKRAAQLKDE